MDISEQKLCMICGMKKPVTAFGSKNGTVNAICLSCLAKSDGEDQSGGGLQVNIIDKLAAITTEQKQDQLVSAENFEVVIERLNEQTERSHQQDNNKKYSTGLFNDRRTGDASQTTDSKTFQKQTTEAIQSSNSDQTSQHNRSASQDNSKSAQTTSAHFQNTLFSNNEKQSQQSTHQEPTTVSADHSDHTDGSVKPHHPVEKANKAIIRSALFNLPAETLRAASGDKAVAATTQKSAETKPVNKVDEAATNFINTLLRGPGRR